MNWKTISGLLFFPPTSVFFCSNHHLTFFNSPTCLVLVCLLFIYYYNYYCNNFVALYYGFWYITVDFILLTTIEQYIHFSHPSIFTPPKASNPFSYLRVLGPETPSNLRRGLRTPSSGPRSPTPSFQRKTLVLLNPCTVPLPLLLPQPLRILRPVAWRWCYWWCTAKLN